MTILYCINYVALVWVYAPPPREFFGISSLLRSFLMTTLWLNSMDDLLQNVAIVLARYNLFISLVLRP